MRTLRVPFQIDGRGGLAVVEDSKSIVEQQITDILVTGFYERVMNPAYGAGLQNLIFQPILSTVLSLSEETIRNLLESTIVLAKIVSVSLRQSAKNVSTIDVAVVYSLNPSTATQTYRTTVSALITEETFGTVF